MRKKIIVLCMAMIMAAGSISTAWAVDYSSDIAEAENKKSEAQDNLASVTADIAEIEARQEAIQEQINELDAELVNTLIDIETTKKDIEQAQTRLNQTKMRYAEARATEEEQLNSMKERVRYMYENGDTSVLEALLESNDFTEILNKLETYETVYEFDRSLLEEYEQTEQEVADLLEEVEAEEADLEYSKIILEDQEAELEAQKDEKSAEMADFDEKLSEAEDLAAQYETTIADMNDKIEELQEKQRKADEEAAAAASSSGSAQAGSSNVSYSSTGQSVADYACQFIGNPYVWGGTSLTNGCDCSGFVCSVYAKFGISLPHSSSALRTVGTGVSVSSMMPGDIVCYSGHVGIYVGNGTIVNASNSKPYPAGGIKYSNAYYKTILAVRRIFT